MKIFILSDYAISAEGLAALLERKIPGAMVACCRSLEDALVALGGEAADVMIVDSETLPSLAALRMLLRTCGETPLALWGVPPREFAVQAVYSGVRGVVSKRESAAVAVEAIDAIASGRRWFDQEILDNCLSAKPVTLTPREAQLVSLISQGLRNKEAAHVMGTTEGTVKVYVSRLFKRLNVSDRLELALYGLKNLNMAPAAAPRQLQPAASAGPLDATCLNTIVVH